MLNILSIKSVAVIKWSVLLLPVLCALACERPGEGDDARVGYAKGNKIVLAIYAYKSQYGNFPAGLEELIPVYLNREDLQMKTNSKEIEYFSYRKNEIEFWLNFSYGRPGRNICSYESANKAWSCIGYY